MTEPCQKLQTSLSDILKDLMSMSADVIKKANVHLIEVESLNDDSAEVIASKVKTLLERVNTNLSSFLNTYHTALSDFQEANKNENTNLTPKRKLNLSLIKSPEGEDLITSDDETQKSVEPSVSNGNEKTVEDAGRDEDEASDVDSEKSILNFDVPMNSAASLKNLSDDDAEEEFVKALDVLHKSDAIKPIESMSFDFDDQDDELLAEMTKLESVEEELRHQRDNTELLELLNKALPNGSQDVLTDNDGEEAVKLLEDELSYSTDMDSEDSMSQSEGSSDDWKPSQNSVGNGSDSADVSDVESEEEKHDEESSNLELKELKIELKKKVDQMSDDEIDRLCNLESINKRKCVKALNHLRKNRRKRIRKLSSSSSSLSSDLSSNECATPEIPPDQYKDAQTPPRNGENLDITVLADQLADDLDEEDDEKFEISSDSESDVESTEKKKEKAKTIKEESLEPENQNHEESEDESPKAQKKRGSWRNEVFFGMSSDSDDDDDPVVVLNDPVEKIDEEDEDSKELKLKIANDGETMVITDSNSDSDDSVTFVAELLDDSPGQRGRRNIRAIISDDELNVLTQRAKNEEDERILRLEEHSKTVESVQSQCEDLVLDADVKTGQPLITVDHNLVKILKPHQKEGVTFMWQACYESVEMLKTKPGTGCILAHCMGLGKTLQVITLIHTLFKYTVTRTRHVLVICPLSTVTNWKNEFKKTFRNLDGTVQIRRFFIVKGDISEKIRTVLLWRKSEGVLVMGYESFQILSNQNLATRVNPTDQKATYEALVNPGPDLIVCDEGHQLKNDKTLRTKALVQVKTKRRIVLTGTPLQNNLKEYYWMVNFVKPHLLGTDKEYLNRFATPITNGQYFDSRPEDIKLMKKRTHVLNKLLKKTIHRVESGVLMSYLPEIVDYTVFVKLSPLQMELYQKYISLVTREERDLRTGYLADVMMLNINNLHPYALQLHYNRPRAKKKKKRTEDAQSEDENHETGSERVDRDWFKSSLPEDAATGVEHSPKLKLILDLVDEATRIGDKVLIFGQRRAELDVLENFLRVCGTSNCRTWRPNFDYYRMDGETSVERRDELCKDFNNNPTAKIFLLTHRVGGLGLNLTGANRVIMIGSNHNPSLDSQSMYRVYRFGQNKKCYVYRLLSLATMEEKIYHRCVVKLHLSGTVVDKLHFTRKITSTDLQEMYKVDFSEYVKERPIPSVPNDKLLALLLQNSTDIYKCYPHNSLLENRPEDELTEADKQLAWDEFNSMEEASKLEAHTKKSNPASQVPIFPANKVSPYNQFRQFCAPRASASSMVPNPMNSNVRGFIPRGLLPNGMVHGNPQINYNNLQPFPRPRIITNAGTPNSKHLQWSYNSPAFPASTLLQNLRENISNTMRDQPRPGDGSTSGGEFNYSMNKVL